jgi:hypothetical protein
VNPLPHPASASCLQNLALGLDSALFLLISRPVFAERTDDHQSNDLAIFPLPLACFISIPNDLTLCQHLFIEIDKSKQQW